MDIYISTGDDSVDSSYPVNSSSYFVIEKLDAYFDWDNPLSENFKINGIGSRSSGNTTASTTE